jgi:hypothetical protein
VKYDYTCSNYFDNSVDNDYDFQKIEKINNERDYGSRKNINAPFYNSDFNHDDRSSYCKELDTLLVEIKNDVNFKKDIEKLSNLKKEQNNLESQKNKYERNYKEFREDTSA